MKGEAKPRREISFTKAAAKSVAKMDRRVAERIVAKLEQYSADPASLANNVKALAGEEGILRLRVGDYRAVFTETMVLLLVIKVGHRSDIYD